ncbi:uncharacterized protein LOC125429901 [Sphaerodactylus townsendi]|uniref:uncharacterized protein LOC125429901 n=1 Tax=Sphaerodactylus townsendi TaxID=933632 RepID=UPI002027666A|nr:uncharacterized protein LOC125429901 [Sphaerodactylus townsendi]
MDSENGKVNEAVIQEMSEEHLIDLKKERAHEGTPKEPIDSKKVSLQEEKESVARVALPENQGNEGLTGDESVAEDHFSGPVHPPAPASQTACDLPLSPQDNKEKLTDRPESRDDELKAEEESGSEELIIDEKEEGPGNDTEVLEAGSIRSREDESLRVLGIEEIRQRYGDLCQSNAAFQEMMLSLKGDLFLVSGTKQILGGQRMTRNWETRVQTPTGAMEACWVTMGQLHALSTDPGFASRPPRKTMGVLWRRAMATRSLKVSHLLDQG